MIKNQKELFIKMATLLKMDVAKVTAALDDTDNETEVELKEDLKIFTPAELTSREETLKTQHENAGKEIAIKTLKQETGVEFEGKDSKKFIEAYKAKVLEDANVKESDKIKELNTTIEGLRANINTLTTEKDTFVRQSREAQLDSDILSMTIDMKPDNLTNKQWLALIKMDNQIEDSEGGQVVKRDGKVVANSTDLKPLPVKDALIGYITESKIGKSETPPTPRGRAAGDSRTDFAGIANMKQFNEHLAQNNINPNGDKAQQLLTEVTAKNPNFDFTPAG